MRAIFLCIWLLLFAYYTNAVQERCKLCDKVFKSLGRPRYYISLMDVAQNLIFLTSYYIYFKLLMIVFSI